MDIKKVCGLMFILGIIVMIPWNYFEAKLIEATTILIQGVLKAIEIITFNTQYVAHDYHRPDLLMLGNERIFYFVSLAKKTVAFFRISRSISKRFT